MNCKNNKAFRKFRRKTKKLQPKIIVVIFAPGKAGKCERSTAT